MRRHRISDDDLAAILRKEGLTDPSEVALATIEVTGHVTVVPTKRV